MRWRIFSWSTRAQRSDLDDCIGRILSDALALEEDDFLVILTYLETSPTALSNEAVQDTLKQLLPRRKEQILGPITQPYYEKGLAEGRAEGEAKILTFLLERRFGALPAPLRQRISAADAGAIEAWAARVFEAADLQSVFE